MASFSRLELRVAPVTGRDYTAATTTNATSTSFLDIPENDLDPDPQQFQFHTSFRGCCYNALTRTLLVCDPVACCVHTFDVEIHGDVEMRVLPRGQIGERGTGAGKFQCPVAIDVSARGELAVADYKLNRVAFFTGSGNALHYFGKTGSGRGEFRGIVDLQFTALGHVAVVDSENHRVQVMTTTGGLVLVVGRHGAGYGELMAPCAVAIARSNGDLFVCDAGNKRIQRFSAKGKWLAVWGAVASGKAGTRHRHHHQQQTQQTQGFVPSTWTASSPAIKSVFETPCDVLMGINGEVLVCDAGRQDVLVFSDAGSCLHVVAMPYKPKWSPIAVCIVRNSLLVAVRATVSPITGPTTTTTVTSMATPVHVQAPPPLTGTTSTSTSTTRSSNHRFVLFAPPLRVSAGKLALWPWSTLLEMVSYLTYSDAIHVRLVSRIVHRACRVLRNEWKLFPLMPGHATITKYNQVVHRATGRMAVTECFSKWGLRIFKPANRIRRHVMDFDAGFRNAVSALFGPLFVYQHEEPLREMFAFHSRAQDKQEIDEAAFVEIVTEIQEIQAGFLEWRQCPSLSTRERISEAIRTTIQPSQSSAPPAPPHLQQQHQPQEQQQPQQYTVVAQLTLVENAQQHQLNRLLGKLQGL